MEKITLIKPGELWLKGRNRGDFLNRLVLNIENETGISKKDIQVEQGRIYILNSNFELQTSKLKYIFGIHSFVGAYRIERDYAVLEKTAAKLASEKIGDSVKTFRISSTRGYKSFEKTSEEINREIGGALIDAFPGRLKVKLEDPDLDLVIEVRKEGIYLYFRDEELSGAKGLPVGVSGKGLLMLSGGIDSPVAGWLMMKRGMAVDAVYFHSPPYTGDKTKEKIIDLCRALSGWKNSPIRLFVPRFTEIQTETSKSTPDPFLTILHRRFMTKITEKLAKEHGYNALITGDSLGQVSSQTIENISAISGDINTPILRPLVGYDKQDTIHIAKSIETYPISILPYEDCCTVFASNNPRTKSTSEALSKLEKQVDGEKLMSEAIEKMEVYKVLSDKVQKIS